MKALWSRMTMAITTTSTCIRFAQPTPSPVPLVANIECSNGALQIDALLALLHLFQQLFESLFKSARIDVQIDARMWCWYPFHPLFQTLCHYMQTEFQIGYK